jgi:tetratricopeptide (TPR) repeat protein
VPYEFDHSGNPNFDYWYGVAALESAHPDKATLALERALAVNPDYVAARLDLARSYFALGDMDRARVEFGVVLAQNPPTPAKLTIDRYLAEIDRRTQTKRTTLTGYLEGVLGRDTNVNNATSQKSRSRSAVRRVFLPVWITASALTSARIRSITQVRRARRRAICPRPQYLSHGNVLRSVLSRSQLQL